MPKPRVTPPILQPIAGHIRVQCSVDCACCGRREKLLRDGGSMWGLRTLEKMARELGWRCIRLRWFCPECASGARG